MDESERTVRPDGMGQSRWRALGLAIPAAWLTILLASVASGQLALPTGSLPSPPPKATAENMVEVEVVSQFDQVGPGQEFALAVVLKIEEGSHLYANPKQGEFGIDTEIIPQPAPGLQFGGVIYPPGREYVDKLLEESNHIYEGTVVCYVMAKVDPDASGQVPVVLEFKGLTCTDTTCLPWEDQAEITISIAEGLDATSQTSNRPDLFAGLNSEADGASSNEGWLAAIGLALGAGLLMNLMPCVLPLIPIIIMTLMKQCAPEEGAPPDRGKSIRIGLAFAAGILLVFVGLAIVMSVFKLLWGQQFQGTGFKLALLMIVYVLSLSMFGLFEIALPSRFSNISIVRQGYLGALGMGMLVTVLGTPCGAPLLTGVLAWSAGKPLLIMTAVFLIIGVGMAAPYVLLTAFPQLLGRVPKGGNWMIRLKQAIGFAMLAFSAYLMALFPSGWFVPLLYFCLLVGFCIWLGGYVVNAATPVAKRYIVRIVALVLIIVGSVMLAQATKASGGAAGTDDWYGRLEEHQQQGKTVIVKFTANWCKNCSTLDKLIYKKAAFQNKLAETGAELVIADWSDPDLKIDEMLRQYGQQSLPFATVFPGADADNPILLRDFYTLDETLDALDEASKRSGGI